MLLGDALAFVAGEVCIRVAGVIRDGTQTVRISPGRIEAGSHTLWLAKGAKLFTLTKHEGQTLVYCHDNQTGYYGAPGATLCSECPDGHAFLVRNPSIQCLSSLADWESYRCKQWRTSRMTGPKGWSEGFW